MEVKLVVLPAEPPEVASTVATEVFDVVIVTTDPLALVSFTVYSLPLAGEEGKDIVMFAPA